MSGDFGGDGPIYLWQNIVSNMFEASHKLSRGAGIHSHEDWVVAQIMGFHHPDILLPGMKDSAQGLGGWAGDRTVARGLSVIDLSSEYCVRAMAMIQKTRTIHPGA